MSGTYLAEFCSERKQRLVYGHSIKFVEKVKLHLQGDRIDKLRDPGRVLNIFIHQKLFFNEPGVFSLLTGFTKQVIWRHDVYRVEIV